MNEKVILTDCDGVLLDWYNHFSKWMDKRGYKSRPIESYEVYGQVLLKRYDLTLDEHDALCQEFNHSAWVRFVPSIRDAVAGIKRLHEEYGYEFHVITAFGGDYYSKALRVHNLKKYFGDAITKVVWTPFRGSKLEALSEYKGTNYYWLDDKPRHAESGLTHGLKSVIMEHDYNLKYKDEGKYRKDIHFVKDWKHFTELVQ